MRGNQGDQQMDGEAHHPDDAPGGDPVNNVAGNVPDNADDGDEGLELNADEVVEIVELDDQAPNEGKDTHKSCLASTH